MSRPITGLHEYGIHSSKLGNTTWIARSSEAARLGIINYEGAQNVGELTICRLRSNVAGEPTPTARDRMSAQELEKQLGALLEQLKAADTPRGSNS